MMSVYEIKLFPIVNLIDSSFVYIRYPATLLIPLVDVQTSPERKCNIHVYDTVLQPIYLSTPIITEPPSVECQDLLNRCMRRGNRSVRILVYSLFRNTRAAQNIAPEGIRTQHLLHARQVPYP